MTVIKIAHIQTTGDSEMLQSAEEADQLTPVPSPAAIRTDG